MRELEFDVGDGVEEGGVEEPAHGHSAGHDRASAPRPRSALSWIVPLAGVLIVAGLGLAQQNDPLFTADEPTVRNYIVQDDDGGVHTWTWRGDPPLQESTAARVSQVLVSMTDVSDWSCLSAADPDGPPAPFPGTGALPDPGFTCTSTCTQDSPDGCTTTVWIPPAGWEQPEEQHSAADGATPAG